MTPEIAEALLFAYNLDDKKYYKEIKGAWPLGTTVSYNTYYAIYQDCRDESYWKIVWEECTEPMEDPSPRNISFKRVIPVEKTVVIFTDFDKL